MNKLHTRPFLKWPGGKYRLRHIITELLPHGKVLVEPFIGSGSIFLNTNYPKYYLSDANSDLINLYQILQHHGKQFIDDIEKYFTAKNNSEKIYYRNRDKFNETNDPYLKALLLLYLNRHGYNGLVRYNNSGKYNVPFGRYKKPYFPHDQLHYFHQHSQKAEFICQDFRITMKNAKKNHVVYCDPPYVPLSHSASFTAYSRGGFNQEDQEDLAKLAEKLSQKGTSVLISNHATPMTESLYQSANKQYLDVPRFISQNTKTRRPVKEVLAFYHPKKKD